MNIEIMSVLDYGNGDVLVQLNLKPTYKIYFEFLDAQALIDMLSKEIEEREEINKYHEEEYSAGNL